MPFLPSLLEYSPQDLETKLELIKNNLEQFQTIQKSPDNKVYLHLDFVLPEFAKSRDVQPGNSPQIVFDLIDQYFQHQKVVCNCHFMGTKNDTQEVLEFFKTYSWNQNWEYIFYVGQEFMQEFRNKIEFAVKNNPSQLRCQPLINGQFSDDAKNKIDLQIGVWLIMANMTQTPNLNFVITF